MCEIYKSTSENGAMWSSDTGSIPIRDFLSQYKHEDWPLVIYDIMTGDEVKIECRFEDIIDAINCVYSAEHGEPIVFIEEAKDRGCYRVGMPFTRGRIEAPGDYVFCRGRLSLKTD